MRLGVEEWGPPSQISCEACEIDSVRDGSGLYNTCFAVCSCVGVCV